VKVPKISVRLLATWKKSLLLNMVISIAKKRIGCPEKPLDGPLTRHHLAARGGSGKEGRARIVKQVILFWTCYMKSKVI